MLNHIEILNKFVKFNLHPNLVGWLVNIQQAASIAGRLDLEHSNHNINQRELKISPNFSLSFSIRNDNLLCHKIMTSDIKNDNYDWLDLEHSIHDINQRELSMKWNEIFSIKNIDFQHEKIWLWLVTMMMLACLCSGGEQVDDVRDITCSCQQSTFEKLKSSSGSALCSKTKIWKKTPT